MAFKSVVFPYFLIFVTTAMLFPTLNGQSSRFHEYLQKQWNFVTLGASVVFLSATQMTILLVTMVFAGKLSQAHLDGIGLANTIYGLCVAAICFGYSTVFDTYGPQVGLKYILQWSSYMMSAPFCIFKPPIPFESISKTPHLGCWPDADILC